VQDFVYPTGWASAERPTGIVIFTAVFFVFPALGPVAPPGAVIAVYVGNIQESSSIKADIHEGRLHSRQYLYNTAAVYIAQKLLAGVSFGVKFCYRSFLHQGHPGFVRTHMYYKFDGHTGVPPR
jgi:hypothetical protein